MLGSILSSYMKEENCDVMEREKMGREQESWQVSLTTWKNYL